MPQVPADRAGRSSTRILRPTALGPTRGNSGCFTGYATELVDSEELGIATAVQVNTADPYPRGLATFPVEAARTASRGLPSEAARPSRRGTTGGAGRGRAG